MVQSSLNKRSFLSFSIYLLLAVAFAYLLIEHHPGTMPIGTVAPLETSFVKLNKRTASIKRLLNRPLLVNFFATWCPACHKEMPALSRLSKRYEANIAFLGLAAGSKLDDVLAFKEKYHVGYEVGTVDDATLDRWQARSMPTTYLLDSNGRVVWAHAGAVSEEELEAAIKRVFKG